LRAMLKFQGDRPDIRAVQANNIGGDPTGLMEILTIDKGSDDGLRKGMAVVSPGGILVGQVSDVKAGRATVLLITDIDSSIAVATQRTQTPGVLEGQWQKGGRTLVRRIPRDADVKEGDILLTSGVGGSFPKGLIAAQISNIRQSDVQMEKEAEAYPLVELNSLENVLVITSGGQK
jgi:rod shape-determining protein MreC